METIPIMLLMHLYKNTLLPESMISELPFVILITGAVIAGLWISNIVYDHGTPQYISRKIGHGAGGLAFLASFVLSSAWWPLIVSAGFSALILAARLFRPEVIRGIGGAGRSSKIMAEVWFPLVAVPVFAISWLWLDKPEVAVVSLLFMAWGDGITGLVRSQVYGRPVKGLWGSLAMLVFCLVVSWVFINPFWIGAVASVVATVAERIFGDCGVIKWADDNWAIPLVSMATILGLLALVGIL
jgi:phytol kinase